MNFLKGLALGLLSFLLFLSLSVFGLALTLNYTILNPDFIVSEVDRLDIPSLAEEFLSEEIPEEELPEELRIVLVDTIAKLEPVVKEQVSATIYPVFDYLRGKSQSPDLALTLSNAIFNSDSVASLLNEIDVSSLAEALLSEEIPEEEFPEELRVALIDTIAKLEPVVKEQVSAAADPIFDYLLGISQSPDLALTLRNTFLNSGFVASLLDELDLPSLAEGFLTEEVIEEIPEEMEYLVEYMDDVIAELEPWVKEQVSIAADPIFDYLLGESQSLSVVISLEPVIESLQDTLREAFLESPPPDLADLPPAEIEQHFDEYFQELAEMMPSTFEIDESLLDTEIPAQIAEALAEVEEALEQARQGIAEALAEAEGMLEQVRQYVGYFQLGYNILIGFILLLILGIVLINRQVKGATRGIGIPFLCYGLPWFIAILIAKNIIGKLLAQPDIPAQFQTLLPQLLSDFLAPLQWFSLGLLVAGLALIIVSFVYKPRQASF